MNQEDINEVMAKNPTPEAHRHRELMASARPELIPVLRACREALESIANCKTSSGEICAPNVHDFYLVTQALDSLKKL